MKKILLISTGSPATNPRLVKEANALQSAGHNVHVLYSYVIDWAEALDKKIIEDAEWTAELVGGSPCRDRLIYLASSWGFKFIRRINWKPLRFKRLSRTSKLLIRKAKRYRADLYVAHNLGALAAAILAAQHHGSKAAFDAEDYHHGEFPPESSVAQITHYVENAWMPKCDESWSASPLISQAYQSRFPNLAFHVIDNVFPLQLQRPFESNSMEAIRFIWFSQTIGSDRGLETFFEALRSCSDFRWELTLIGRVDEAFEPRLKGFKTTFPDAVNIMPPMEEAGLFAEMAQHHIGLCLEPTYRLNNDLARSNKLFSYILSGCHLMLTDTSGQLDFLNTYPDCGTVLPNRAPQQWASIIRAKTKDRDRLQEQRLQNWTLGRDILNWEYEQRKLLAIVDEVTAP